MAQRWAYRVEAWQEEKDPVEMTVDEHLTAVLNALGRDGWELIGVIPTARRGRTMLTFKKPLSGFVATD